MGLGTVAAAVEGVSRIVVVFVVGGGGRTLVVVRIVVVGVVVCKAMSEVWFGV